ncbi:MAG: hypothetical protein L3J12_03680, partial [Spirochaetales bacterium]|nr:hypothetical protein [Spirochaetales bacterium]
MKHTVSILIIILFLGQILQISAADLDNNSIIIKPAFELPLGDKSSLVNSDAPFKPGGSVSFNLQYIPPNIPLLFFSGILGYSVLPTQAENLTVVTGGLRSGLNFRFGDVLSLNTGLELGWYVGMYPGNDAGSNPYAGGNIDLS